MRGSCTVFSLVLAAILTGCTNIGPKTIARDRFSYSDAISDSWQQEMLLNIVKIRYGDTPVFLEVASVISQYSLESEISAGANFSNGLLGDTQNIGAKGKFTDRPTVTYVPLTGARFTRSILRPIPVKAVLDMIESGWPADLVLRLMVESINGHRNRNGAALLAHPGDPEFFRVCDLLTEIQQSRAVGIRTHTTDETLGAIVFPEMGTTEIEDERDELRALLNVTPDGDSFKITQSSVQQGPDEIAFRTRSMLMILADIAARIDIPQQDIDEGRATDPFSGIEFGSDMPAAKTAILYSEQEPTDAFIAVKYRNKWFYIDDKNINSKRAFTFIMIIFSLTDTDEQNATPIITVPTG